MEDYAGASGERFADIEVLLACSPKRSVAAMHIGGVAVECQIKAIILKYHRIARWNDLGARAQDGRRGQSIERPGHSLISGVRLMSKIYDRAKADRQFLAHLDRLTHPVGSQDADFIDLRYAASAIEPAALEAWKKSLDYVKGWLQKNEVLAA